MKFHKRLLCELDQCYSIGLIEHNGRRMFLAASEGTGPCYAFDAADFSRTTVWEQPGGTMAIAQLPDANGAFFAIQNFFPVFQSADATVVRAVPFGNGWDLSTVLPLPYVHRIDAVQSHGITHFIGATLCEKKNYQDDWSHPGSVYTGIISPAHPEHIDVQTILTGLTKNHGYCRHTWQGIETSFVSADEGVFTLRPPRFGNHSWQTEHIINRPVSDLAFCDIDEDGEDEMATIEPFHGDHIVISKYDGNKWHVVYECPADTQFAHAIWGGRLRGIPTFVFGCRGGRKKLIYVQKTHSGYTTKTIDEHTGPSNVAVINGRTHDLLISAERENGSVSAYIVTN